MTNVEKLEKIEEIIKEIAILDNKNVDDAVKAFGETLDDMYIKLNIVLNSYKELKGNDKDA